MSLAVFLVVLFAAALHATWNAAVKRGEDKLLTTTLVAGGAALVALICLPVVRPPEPASWPFLATSVALQIVYFVLIAQAYRQADMSQAYPLMRGAAPLVVAVVGASFLRESLSLAAWGGIGLVCAGILTVAAVHSTGRRQGVRWALANAGVIAAYTLVDGAGVRLSQSPAAYTLWIFLLTGVPLVAWVALAQRTAFPSYASRNWRSGLMGGTGAVASYGLALWAMTNAPIAIVAALRETSILFGVLISVVALQEDARWSRIVGACVIAAGTMALKFS
jgi:drug/metabolite transporter (DMT)-like permease